MNLFAIIAATFVSEDLTCIAVGLLIAQERLDAASGLLGCVIGIFVGDLGLWTLGHFGGRRLLRWKWLARRLPTPRVEQLGRWFDTHGWTAIVGARFVPGTRFPVYVGAGMVGAGATRFAVWALLAALLWTPALVLLVAYVGAEIVAPLHWLVGPGWPALAAGALVLFIAWRVCVRAGTSMGRSQLMAGASRLWRWEFWPTWLFYMPLYPWILWLALRHRGLTTPTAANPGIPQGGIVGESKWEILRRLPPAWVVPGALLGPDEADARSAALARLMHERAWEFPLILKPDAGQRGAGVRKISALDEAQRYFAAFAAPIVAQTYHPGPFEAGVFYYRLPPRPGEAETPGRILSITDKHFPVLVGDGRRTLEELVWRHPRLRMQARKFLSRFRRRVDDVLGAGERLPLVVAGNHCQGTLFRDGAHLITPELEARIDEIARSCEGFFFGRFDIRYSDPARLAAGEGFAIIELNGLTSESTNIYDPAWPIRRAWRQLFEQWAIVFEIGARNRARGHPTTPLREVLREIRAFYAGAQPDALAD